MIEQTIHTKVGPSMSDDQGRALRTEKELLDATRPFAAESRVTSWWCVGSRNIGFHHVHHLNSLIPFYRLPEAMAATPELQQPLVTSLRPRDVLDCLRLNLWDAQRQRLVSYQEATK